MKLVLALAAIGCFALVAPAAHADNTLAPQTAQAVPLLSGEHIAKIREEIRLQEGRARELEPIIQRDRQARHDVEVNWGVLERHARELHERAKEFRNFAGVVGGRAQQDLNGFAGELDTYASHDEENARIQHEIGERLDRMVKSEVEAREWHQKNGARLKDWLASNGG